MTASNVKPIVLLTPNQHLKLEQVKTLRKHLESVNEAHHVNFMLLPKDLKAEQIVDTPSIVEAMRQATEQMAEATKAMNLMAQSTAMLAEAIMAEYEDEAEEDSGSANKPPTYLDDPIDDENHEASGQ